jgi:serine protease
MLTASELRSSAREHSMNSRDATAARSSASDSRLLNAAACLVVVLLLLIITHRPALAARAPALAPGRSAVVTNETTLTTPPPGSTLPSSRVTFEWTMASGVSEIVLYVGTTGPGSYDVYYASQGTSLSSTVSGLPTAGTIYVRLWSYLEGAWQYSDYTYQGGRDPSTPGLTTPAPGSTLTSSTVTFAWTAGSAAVSQVALYVSKFFAGGSDIYGAYQGASLSSTVSGLPTDGRTVYVRLWWYVDGGWRYDDYTYTACTHRAQLTAPTPGSTLTSSTVTFEWTAGTGVSQVALYVGTGGFGSYDIYHGYQGASLSATVSGLPSEGALFVRLWSYLAGGWQYADYTYPVGTARVHLATPTPGSALFHSTVVFGWTASSDVSQVALYVGTGGVGSYDIYYAYQGRDQAATVSGLPTSGGTIYVRLWWQVDGGWQYEDYTYTAGFPAQTDPLRLGASRNGVGRGDAPVRSV